jgi:FMN reductase
MPSTLIVTGSPSSSSRTLRLAAAVAELLGKHGLDSALLDLRALPADDLMLARVESPAMREAIDLLASARGIVFVTPIYKAAYSGLLKTFLDSLPQYGLRDKVVLPLAMGGSPAHVLAIDYALRPVLSSLDPMHIVAGLFLLDTQLVLHDDGSFEIDRSLAGRVESVIGVFAEACMRAKLALAPPTDQTTQAS